MMIHPGDMTIGSVIFKVNGQNNAFNMKKMTMLDNNGIEWFRYDRPRITWYVEEYQLVGIVSVVVVGVVEHPDNYYDEYHFKHVSSGKFVEVADNEQNFWDLCFDSLPAAEAHAARLQSDTADY